MEIINELIQLCEENLNCIYEEIYANEMDPKKYLSMNNFDWLFLYDDMFKSELIEKSKYYNCYKITFNKHEFKYYYSTKLDKYSDYIKVNNTKYELHKILLPGYYEYVEYVEKCI